MGVCPTLPLGYLPTYSCQTVKTKEEKEVLEHFAGVVSWCSLTLPSILHAISFSSL